jgi:hypothetical protein
MKVAPDKEQFPWLLVFLAAVVLIFVLLMTKNARSQELETQAAIHAAHQSQARH